MRVSVLEAVLLLIVIGGPADVKLLIVEARVEENSVGAGVVLEAVLLLLVTSLLHLPCDEGTLLYPLTSQHTDICKMRPVADKSFKCIKPPHV